MRKGIGAAALGISALSLIQPCSAQSEQELEKVVVTATRFPQPVEEPVNVQVITAEEIRQSTATTIDEVLSELGGVQTRQNLFGTADASLDLRGFGVTGDQNTLVLVDGQRISEYELQSARISTIPLNAISRIEIVRGGGAVLYGSGATGGTINIITRPSGGKPGGTVAALVGTYGTYDARASLRSGGEGLSLSLDASQRDTDNYRDNNRAKQTNFSGEARMPIDGGAVGLRFGASRQRTRLPGARSEAQLESDPRGTSTPDDHASLDVWNVGLFGDKRIDGITLAADVGYRVKENVFFNRFSDGSFSRQTTNTDVLNASPRVNWRTDLGTTQSNFTFGFDWSDWTYRTHSRTDSTFAFGGPETVENAGQRNEALYALESLRFASGTKVIGGWRAERIENDVIVPASSFGAVQDLTERRRTLHASELSLSQEFGEAWTGYLRYGRSFRIANVDENRCFFTPCSQLEPQTSRDLEVGADYHSAPFRLHAAAFQNRLENEVYFNAVNFSNVNLPPTRRRGVELDLATKLAPTVDLNAHYQYVRATFRSGTYDGFDAAFNPVTVDLAGKTVPVVPRHRASLLVGWNVQPATRLSYALSYVGQQYYDNDPANRFRRMPSYTISDVKLAHRISGIAQGLTLSAGISNLFDKAYYGYGIVDSAVAPSRFNAYPEWRRSAYVSAELAF